MIIAINYATPNFRRAQKLNSWSVKFLGKIDKVIEYSPEDIDKIFYEENSAILDQKKGAGYWLWKPYFVNKTLLQMKEGDYLFYCDSGAMVMSSLIPIVREMEKRQTWLISFDVGLIEKQYTKRDAFVLMDCDTASYKDSNQSVGGYFLIRKCEESISFFDQYLKYAKDSRILFDTANVCGLEDDASFVVHRHDQSIFSLMCKKNNVVCLPDPSVFPERIKFNKINKNNFIFLHRKKMRKFKDYTILLRSIIPIVIVNFKRTFSKGESYA